MKLHVIEYGVVKAFLLTMWKLDLDETDYFMNRKGDDVYLTREKSFGISYGSYERWVVI